jgi:hypothetical protein
MGADKIPIEPVPSSSLAGLGYNRDKQIAAVEFQSGVIYHYAPFSEALFREWCAAPSLGKWYAEHVRGKMAGQKMTGHCPKCGAQGWVGDACEDCGCAPYAEDARKSQEAK